LRAAEDWQGIMALRTGLGLWAYTSPLTSAYPLLVGEYSETVEALEFSTVAPGGFGDLVALVKLPDARLPRPELGLFSRVCLRDGLFTCFSGEWADPALVLDSEHGEHVLLSALGGGVALRDDPDDSSYSAQTARQIVAAEFSKRSAYLAVDGDRSLVFPSNPGTTLSPVYDGRNLEEVVSDLCFSLGDYVWSVYDHALNRDAAGFPTWQLQAHARDTATTSYTALGEDILSWRVAPSQQRAYNVVQVLYVDVTNGPASITVADPRLAGSGAQGNAPFRRRKLRVNLGASPLTSGQATTIAQAWLVAYQNVTNKVEVELRSVRDAQGNPLALARVRADGNLFVPELAVRGQTLPSGPVAGINQFYIVETTYRELASGDVRLVLDNYPDHAGKLLGRLQVIQEASRRYKGQYRQVASPGAPEVGACGLQMGNQLAGDTCAVVVNFKQVMAAVPSAVNLTVTSSSNAGTATATNRTVYGFTLNVPVVGN
jgi:hypothetical protein